ncbi:MAG: ExbD/TolR family protein, partial [Thiotrichaceae bacterium]
MSRRQRKKQMAEMNVVPYIDVMLVLLVIFMVTAPMMQTGVEIDLPEANAAPVAVDNETTPVSIAVDNSGMFYLGDNEINDPAELAHQIADQLRDKPNRPVYIQGDKGVEYNFIMKAMVAAQNAG